MTKISKTICFLLFVSFSIGCSKEYEIPQDLVVHDFVWKGLNAYYLNQDQIEDLSDRRFNSDQELNAYLSTFPDFNTLFSSLLLTTDTKSNLIEDFNTLVDKPLRSALINGLEFGIIEDPSNSDNVLGYVTHIQPASNASTKNITRGEYFFTVDNVQLTKLNYLDILFNGLDNFTLGMANFDGTTVSLNGKTVALEKENYNYPVTFMEKVITVDANNIGYLMYHNDFSSNYISALNNTILSFKNQSVNELILDLRYNIGSGDFVEDITPIATMITSQFPDEVLIKEQWNTKAQPWFLANQPNSLLTKFPTQLKDNTAINSLDLTDVYIILNGGNFTGSSAVELLINSLKPYVNVHIIGNNTKGDNTGSITLYDSEDYDFGLKNTTHTVALQPIVLSFLNKNDQSYENGFSPDLSLCANEDLLDLGVLGEISDPILESVINYISTGTAISNTNCNPLNFEYLFNSILIENDNGVFIKQDLPNTN
jgi:hypothetical protein